MSDIIRCKIDLKKIDKEKLFKGKTGAVYLDCTLLPNRDGQDQYGNHFMIVQDVKKEEREAGVKGAILGNAKIAGQSQRTAPKSAQKPASAIPADVMPPEDDVPF